MPATADISQAPTSCAEDCAHARGYQGRGAPALSAPTQAGQNKVKGLWEPTPSSLSGPRSDDGLTSSLGGLDVARAPDTLVLACAAVRLRVIVLAVADEALKQRQVLGGDGLALRDIG